MQAKGAIGQDTPIFDGFYAVHHSRYQVFPSIALLKSLPPSRDPYCTAVIVDRKRDPELVRLEEMVAPLDLKGTSSKVQALNWPAMSAKHVAIRLSEIVHYHVSSGEHATEEEVSLQPVGPAIFELKSMLKSEILPLGLLRFNVGNYKAFLFKVSSTDQSSCLLLRPLVPGA